MRRILPILALGACLLPGGCSPGYYRQARTLAEAGDPAGAVPLYYREIQEHPANAAAWRELGVAFYDQGDDARAEEALKRAAGIAPDARTQLYLGMVYERRDDPDLALRAYGNALGLEPGGRTRDLLEARVDALTRERVLREVRRSLAGESALAAAEIPANTVAVVEFAGGDLPPELEPLTRGLAEFTALDLAKVGSLRVVDRLKMDAIRKELELSRSQFADPASAPRIGKLVGGRHIVTGTLLGLGDEAVRLDGAVVNTVDRSVRTAEPADGALQDIFKVQKKFVFDVIDALGITLTPAERTEIEKVPTEDYLAFMAYCRGLELRDRNDLGAARLEFQKATAADPGFSQAASQNKSVSSLLSAGFGGPVDFGQFSTAVASVADAVTAPGGLAGFQATMTGWSGFVPVGADLGNFGSWVDSPPHTLFQGNVDVIVRGDLNVRP